jgi:hypothetical protein
MLRKVVTTIKAMIHTAVGTPGNCEERYAPAINHATIGRKK